MGRALQRSAADLASLAEEGDTYGNALGIIAVHAVIAYADALCIAYGGFKSSEGEHLRAVDALQEALGSRVEAEALKHLSLVIQKKDAVSYQGEYFTVQEARSMVARAAAFAAWAEELLARRRPG